MTEWLNTHTHRKIIHITEPEANNKKLFWLFYPSWYPWTITMVRGGTGIRKSNRDLMLCTCAQSLSCVQLCDPMDCSLSGFSVHEILQARILEWADISSFRGSSWPRDWTWASYVSCMGRPILCHWTSWEIGPTAMKVLFTQSCPTLCDPMDCSPPDSSVYGILQAGILKWITIPFSRGSSPPRDQTQASCTAGRFFTIWATSEYYGHDQISLLTKIWFALSFHLTLALSSLFHTRLPRIRLS